jgi:hypothetical protein
MINLAQQNNLLLKLDFLSAQRSNYSQSSTRSAYIGAPSAGTTPIEL